MNILNLFLQELKAYLDEAVKGFVYFNLGTNVKSKLLPNETKRILLNVFAKLPYKVLLKCEENLSYLPKNVKIMKWMPQQDILSKLSCNVSR